MKKDSKGFTVIELLIVIGVIGILSAMILLAFNDARAKSRDSRRIGDFQRLSNAINLYHNDNQNYPTDLTDLSPDYIPALPLDPGTNTIYTYNSANCPASGQSYVLETVLEDDDNPALSSDADGTVCTVNCSDTGEHYCITQ